MTNQERAEKINELMDYVLAPEEIKIITAQLDEAQEEYIEHFKATSGMYCPICQSCDEDLCCGPHRCAIFSKGFAAAREKAAKMAENYNKHLADDIRAMEMDK